MKNAIYFSDNDCVDSFLVQKGSCGYWLETTKYYPPTPNLFVADVSTLTTCARHPIGVVGPGALMDYDVLLRPPPGEPEVLLTGSELGLTIREKTWNREKPNEPEPEEQEGDVSINIRYRTSISALASTDGALGLFSAGVSRAYGDGTHVIGIYSLP